MYKRIFIFSTLIWITIFTLGFTVKSYAGTLRGSKGTFLVPALQYEPGELLVRFKSKTDGSQLALTEKNSVLASINGGTVEHSYKLVEGLTLVKLPESVTVENALLVFKNAQSISYAHPNYIVTGASTFPNDEKFDDLWGMHNTGQTVCEASGTSGADIDAPEAWDSETDATDIIVAVIDSGVDYYHEDIADNMWINPGEDQEPLGVITPEDWNQQDDDGNGCG